MPDDNANRRKTPRCFPAKSNPLATLATTGADQSNLVDTTKTRRKRLGDLSAIEGEVYAAHDGSRRQGPRNWHSSPSNERVMEPCRQLHAELRACFHNERDFYIFYMIKTDAMRPIDMARELDLPDYKVTRELARIEEQLDQFFRDKPQQLIAVLAAWARLRRQRRSNFE